MGWTWTRAILAHAYRLPAREERVEAILAGARPSGIIRADPTDLTPVRAVLESARTLSVELAVRLSRQGSTTAHHILAAHQQWRSRPDSGSELAHARAVATLHTHAPPQLTAQPHAAALGDKGPHHRAALGKEQLAMISLRLTTVRPDLHRLAPGPFPPPARHRALVPLPPHRRCVR